MNEIENIKSLVNNHKEYRHFTGLVAEIDALEAELADARKSAAAWKRSAKTYRDFYKLTCIQAREWQARCFVAKKWGKAWKLCAKNLRRDFIAQGRALIETKNKLTNAQVNWNTFVGIAWPQKEVLKTSCYHYWIDGVCEYCGNVSKMP